MLLTLPGAGTAQVVIVPTLGHAVYLQECSLEGGMKKKLTRPFSLASLWPRWHYEELTTLHSSLLLHLCRKY